MLDEVATEFVYLRVDGDLPTGSQLLTRPLERPSLPTGTLVAVDSQSQKHLLVPIEDDSQLMDFTSQGVVLDVRTLRSGGKDIRYADLFCRLRSLDRVFERLVADVLTRLEAGGSAARIISSALREWRTLLQTASKPISRVTILGLVGELEVLRRIAVDDPIAALEAWRGPSMSVHDFVRVGHEIEVKATASVDGDHITVANLDQLDPSPAQTLHLLVAHLLETPDAPGLDDRISALIGLGVPEQPLIVKMADAGYVYETGTGGTADRFKVRSLRAWRVDESFPGLRRSAIEAARLRGVRRVTYELALDVAPEPLPDQDLEHILRMWSETE